MGSVCTQEIPRKPEIYLRSDSIHQKIENNPNRLKEEKSFEMNSQPHTNQLLDFQQALFNQESKNPLSESLNLNKTKKFHNKASKQKN